MEILTQKALNDKIKITNVEDADEEDRTETFQRPDAIVASDTQAENKQKSTLRKGLLITTQDTLIKYNLANKPKRETVKNSIPRRPYCFYAIYKDRKN